jgi:hypothetical protein
LIVDEIGFLAFDNRNADLLFQVISRRYERKSTVLTTNLAFRDWPTIFPNATCATALIDRVVHHADVIAIEGEAPRSRDRRSRQGSPRSQKRTARARPRRLTCHEINEQPACDFVARELFRFRRKPKLGNTESARCCSWRCRGDGAQHRAGGQN